eukprot:2718955-Prymnesium_polylepis.1
MEMFSTLQPQQQLAFLNAMRRVTFKQGENLVTEGDLGDCFYVIVDGEVRVTQKKKAKAEEPSRSKSPDIETSS